MSEINFPIPYGRQEVTEADIEAVVAVLKHDYLTGGPRIAAFEEAFAAYVGATYAVACSSGTAALHLCTLALGVKPGDRYLTTPITFVASANCVRYAGGSIELVDIDPQTRIMDLDLLEEKLDQAPAGTYQGIVAVDFAGHPVDMERVRALADIHDLRIIEDSCHSPGGFFTDSKGKQQSCGNGAYADLAIFSFHPVKHIATGEGGMVTTNDEVLYQRMIQYRNHGITRDRDRLQHDHGGWYYEMQMLGYNYRLSDIQAALGISQLARAGQNIVKRRALAQRYDEALASLPIVLPKSAQGHAYHLYVIETPHRKALYNYLRTHKIYPQVHYIPIYYQPDYQGLVEDASHFPRAEHYYQQCLSLPLYPTLTEQQQDFVIQTLSTFFASNPEMPSQ
ncbi:MAG: UDP-4-amino-4,6-dideoxy-N-acetyl-beta-L-altrosamine transaminase [Bacteroidota bacterium]